MRTDNFRRFLQPLLCVICSIAAPLLQALPEDAKEPIEISAPVTQLGLDKDDYTLKGSPTDLPKISQGSLQITGNEIHILIDHNELKSAVATGAPARFQVQPKRDQEVVIATGKQIRLDNKTRLLTITTTAEVNLGGGKVVTGNQIECNVDSLQCMISSEAGGKQTHMTIPAPQGKK